MPLADKLRMLACMLRYKLSFDDGVALYGKYVGNWGGAATQWRFEGWKDGAKTCEHTCTPGKRSHLEATPSALHLTERQSWDAAAVRIRIADEQGNTAKLRPAPRDAEAQRGRGACRPCGHHRRGRHVRHIRKDHREERPRAARDIRAADGVCDA